MSRPPAAIQVLDRDARHGRRRPCGAAAGRAGRVRRGGGGFTLTELLVVVAILSLLISMLVPSVHRAMLMARVARVRSDLKHIGSAIEVYATNQGRYPPDRAYCVSAKRHLYHALPPELTETRCLDRSLEDLFAPGRTYRYAAPGPGYVNDTPATFRALVPANFPEPGGKLTPFASPYDAPVSWITWSVGPRGPLASFVDVMQFNPYDPAQWFPRNDDGIVVHYSDGRHTHMP